MSFRRFLHHHPTMDTPESDNSNVGAHRFSDGVRARLQADDFAEELRARILEQNLRAKMLGLTVEPVKLGRWELRASIDQGAMGAVFRAFDPNLRCEVAIKLLLCPDGEDLAERRARMESEAQAMARLKHPNVLRIWDYTAASFDAGGTSIPSFLVMDYVEGKTLHQWQREERTEWREVVEKYAQVAAGLDHIHQHGLVHRDIKPANILMRSTGEVLIGDFGLVHGIERGADGPDSIAGDEPLTASDRLTQQGAILGTLAYMAPEQLRDGTTSPKSDQFSFFVALYEALYGRLPYTGKNRAELLEAMGRARPEVAPGDGRGPRWLRRFLLRGLSMAPDERHPSMGVVHESLVGGIAPKSRSWVGATAGGTMFGAAIIWFALARGPADPCVDAIDLPAWSPVRQAAALAGFKASGAVGADSAWSRFSGRTNHVVRSWQVLKARTCQERHLEGQEVEDSLAQRRESCLIESAELLRVVMERYRHATAGDVYYSENTAFELMDAAERCKNDAGLRLGPAPGGESDSDLAARVRSTIAESLMSEIGGDYPEAAALAGEALESAKQLGSSSLVAEAALRQGRTLSLLRQGDDAAGLLQGAFLAANSVRRDDVAVDALIELIKVLALDTGELSRAAVLDPLLESFVSRTSHDDPRREAAAAEARGLLAYEQGRCDDAVNFQRLALGKRSRSTDTPTGDRVRSHVNLANALTMPGGDQAATTEARVLYKEAVEIALQLGSTHPLVASARRDYATFLEAEGDLDAARQEAEASLAVAQRTSGDLSAEAAILHVLLGTLVLEALSDDEPARESIEPARAHALAAIRCYESILRPGIVNVDYVSALQLSAEVHRLSGEIDEAIADYERALDVLRPSGDYREFYADTLGYLGQFLLDQGRPAEALPRLREAWEIISLAASPVEESDARLVAALAEALAAAGDLVGATRTAREAETIAASRGLSTDVEIRARIDPILNDPRITDEKNQRRKEREEHGSL